MPHSSGFPYTILLINFYLCSLFYLPLFELPPWCKFNFYHPDKYVQFRRCSLLTYSSYCEFHLVGLQVRQTQPVHYGIFISPVLSKSGLYFSEQKYHPMNAPKRRHYFPSNSVSFQSKGRQSAFILLFCIFFF